MRKMRMRTILINVILNFRPSLELNDVDIGSKLRDNVTSPLV
jgi:hypothetical protein